MKIGICDDELDDCLALSKILKETRCQDEIAYFTEPDELLASLAQDGSFQVLFLDIYFPTMKGTELVKKINELVPQNTIQFIFTTTSPDYAVEAFALKAVHYIVKPVTLKKVEEALSRISPLPVPRTGISIKTKSALRFLYLDEIALCQSFDHKIHLQLKNGDVVSCSQTLYELQEKLGDTFILISRGLLVNADYIEQMMSKSCILKNGNEVLLSRRKLKQIHSAYNDFIFSKLRG